METKVIVVQAGDELLAALTKFLGSEQAAQVNAVVNEAIAGVEDVEPECDGCPCICDEGVEEEPEFEFGEIISTDEDEDSFQRVYAVPAVGDQSVTVTAQGVVVKGTRFEENESDDVSFEDLFAPAGGYDEVTAFYDVDDQTLTVTLFKVPAEGVEVQIDGF